jgi:Uncharacterized protein conserved in bacteria (DUF2242)
VSSAVNTMSRCGAALLAVAVIQCGGCASRKVDIAQESISAKAPFSQNFRGSGDTVCWGVKRALLSQGYMLDRPGESGVLTGTRDFQPDPKLNVSYHLQTTCADNRDGTSIVFVTAEREESRLQKMKQSTSVGVGPATLTMPSGSAQVLGVVRRETVKDPAFYDRFFSLVQGYVDQEQQRAAQERRSHDERHAEVRNDADGRNDR